ncbi:hypothetical protein SMC26_23145 [Actinomadura fulvescens]|uniref:Uncharacterized protein n=1 Tax=Actinomadura fulvescens TaxID=46160 RepID=A0ABN3QXH6_9ACTN
MSRRLLLIGAAAALLVPAVPAHAQTASQTTTPAQTRRSETCTGSQDSRGTEGRSAVWNMCLQSEGSHARLDVECWGGAVLWDRTRCRAKGDFEIRKNNEVIKAGSYDSTSDADGYLRLVDRFAFNCQGAGDYTFAINGYFTFTAGGHVRMPQERSTVTTHMC